MSSYSKKIINDPSQVVREAVEGCLLSNRDLKTIEGMNILLRADIDTVKKSYVTLISGGGSGHEPAHAGYIGNGMLSAAVLGNCFASPSVNSILAAIRVCAGSHGTLLLVKNYTGDRLNFGMAAEKAKLEGINVKMVIVADDCALKKNKGITGGRGIAGTVLVHKVAGAAAATGLSLQEVFDQASAAAASIATLGIAFSTCTVPGCPPSTRLDGPVFEVGMGIHGEPGRETMTLPPANTAEVVAKLLVDGILGTTAIESLPVPPLSSSSAFSDLSSPSTPLILMKNDPLILMINNLGATPLIELHITTRNIILYLKSLGYQHITRVYIGSFMTAFEMTGISLSIMKGTNLFLNYLDSTTTASAWIPCSPLPYENTLKDQEISYNSTINENTKISGGFLCINALHVIKSIVQRIIIMEPDLTKYDMICGDGDCGITMRAGAEKILEYVNQDDMQGGGPIDSAQLCDGLGNAISASMGGTSGALLEIMMRAMASYLIDTQSNTKKDWSHALEAGVTAMRVYGGAEVGMRTMLDALIPGINTLIRGGTIQEAAEAAQSGAESTKTMIGLAGRSNYIQQDQMQGVPDPGAVAAAEAFLAACDVL
mmetsp:Transcript_2428/g.2548  ORF Transcript_2428/g.2548 Transcript_2428/m.2548 type:complete len:600 (-) Transcript_2428:136-1935(-)